MEGTLDWTAMEHGCFVIGSEERGYVMYGVDLTMRLLICMFVLFLFIFINDNQLVELEDISIEVWKTLKI